MKKHGKKIYVNSNISKEYRDLEKLKDEERIDIIKNIMEKISDTDISPNINTLEIIITYKIVTSM